MPTQRRRIGFLPRSEVQNIIDKICIINKLSQSKVTGILVEEALRSRGVLNTSIKKLSYEFYSNNGDALSIPNKKYNNEIPMVEDNNHLDDESINDEVQMINDYIEFKFFKNIMNRNKSRIKE
ncbi:hypothetical [Prochlorococcus marinus subsp. pastoris str. CCMP1986]|uniref:Uncharacterized protein n=1 Tax=Prochlorococcus marinus subsp. pastoris (strain CCMP1986 / NIES-2087 / MED4) TaxID=59919 RepID=Q7V1K7_PROMP|nr:hypothetical protein [Prochlorococcus marinus]KGF87586.1 hypothetical protein PROCH_0530 [Prochlorococcus marinus str. EQPAC1]CAE19317.1 hypothetical [Prochlorococcus marinus subsp. pastoris str. CCMP1986]